jgi:dephospho-CoA kinase
MLIVGLTGGIATGKSTVSNLFRKHSLPVIDADILARKAVEPGTSAFNRIVKTFGDDLVLCDSAGNVTGLDRAALGKRVFNGDEAARKKLNAIVHPAVRWLTVKAVIWEWLVNGSAVVILDIPLLFESRLDQFCGVTVVVSTAPELQLQRLLERDDRLSEEDAQGRIASQWKVDNKKVLADVVIENDSSREALEERVNQVVHLFSRSRLWTWLLRIPPIGLLSALVVFLRRRLSRRIPKPKTS